MIVKKNDIQRGRGLEKCPQAESQDDEGGGPCGLKASYNGFDGSWVGRTPNRFLIVTRCRENLSSGENRAGWADLVILPSAVIFFRV